VAVFGYARVSTDWQPLDRQHDALTCAGATTLPPDRLCPHRRRRCV